MCKWVRLPQKKVSSFAGGVCLSVVTDKSRANKVIPEKGLSLTKTHLVSEPRKGRRNLIPHNTHTTNVCEK